MPEAIEVEVLLVEDNATDEELTLRALKKRNLANKVHIARDGAEALEFLFATKDAAPGSTSVPRVILLDLKLPKIDGLEVLRRIKADPVLRTIPVVALTSSRQGPDVRACYALGVNSYIVKPVDFDQFTQAVAELGLYWLVRNERPVFPLATPEEAAEKVRLGSNGSEEVVGEPVEQ